MPPAYSLAIDPKTGQPQPKKRREHPELRDKRLSGWLAAILSNPVETEISVWETAPRVEIRLADRQLIFHAVADPQLAMHWHELNGRQANVEAEAERGFPRVTRVPAATISTIRDVFEDVPEAAEVESDRAAAAVMAHAESENLFRLAA